MLAEPRAHPGARHGVPLVADAAGVQPQRARSPWSRCAASDFRRDEARLAVVGEEAAVGEEARLRLAALPDRPLHRRHGVEIACPIATASAPMSKSRAPLFSKAERPRVRGRSRPPSEVEGRAEAEAPRDLAHDPPVRLAPRPVRAGTRAAARCGAPNWSRCRISRPRLRPAAAHARRRPRCRWRARSRRRRTVRASSAPSRTASASGSDTAGLVPMTHSALISPRAIASNSCDRLQALMGGDARRLPEPAHAVDIRRRKAHVRGELVGEPADLAPAHRVRLAGQRERPMRRACRCAPSRGGS